MADDSLAGGNRGEVYPASVFVEGDQQRIAIGLLVSFCEHTIYVILLLMFNLIKIQLFVFMQVLQQPDLRLCKCQLPDGHS